MANPQGPSSDEISQQAKMMQQLTAAITAQTAAFNAAAAAASTQANAVNEIGEAADAASSALQKANRENEKWREGVQKAIDDVESLSDAGKVFSTVLKKMAKDGSTGAKALLALGAGLKGMASGFKLSLNLAKSFLGGITGIIDGLMDLAAAVLSFPFKVWEEIIGMAKGGGGGGGGLLEALEKVRETFGDIKQGTAKEVIDIAKGLASWGDMAPGLMKTSRQFGTLADSIEYVMKLAGPAPVLFSSLKSEFEKTGKNVFIMAKGLGVSEEEFSGLMSAAKATGTTVEQLEVDMTKFAKGLSAEFGLNSKLMSRDMSKAIKDVKHFANSTVKEIAKATAYAHSLGLELKDITGILDAFNTFDQAAENVSKLSQAFGVNIDVMKLVEAKTPDDALKMLKDSFTSAGKSVENMNRQELQLIASTVGMSEEAVRQGLSSKNQAISMNHLAKTTDNLSKKSMTASEATKALKNDIERVVGGGGGGGPESNSLMGMFFEGFLQGITTTKEFRKIIANLKMDFVVIMEQGRQLGRAFVEYFPGVKKFLEGFSDILSPDKLGKLFESFKNTFTNFFKNMKGDVSIKGLIDSLIGDFKNYLTKAGPGGQQMLDGLTEFWGAAKKIIASAITWIGDTLADGFNMIVDFFEKGDQLNGITKKIQSETGPIVSAFKNAAGKVMPAFKRLFNLAFDYLEDKALEFWGNHWGKILLFFGGPAMVSGLGQAFMQWYAKGAMEKMLQSTLKKALVDQFGAGITEGAAKGASEVATGGGAFSKMFSTLTTGIGGAVTAGIAAGLVAAFVIWQAGVNRMMSYADKKKEAESFEKNVASNFREAMASGDKQKIAEAKKMLEDANKEYLDKREKERGTGIFDALLGTSEQLKEAQARLDSIKQMTDEADKALGKGSAPGKGSSSQTREKRGKELRQRAEAAAAEAGIDDIDAYMKGSGWEKFKHQSLVGLLKSTYSKDSHGEALELYYAAEADKAGGINELKEDIQNLQDESEKQNNKWINKIQDDQIEASRKLVDSLGGGDAAKKTTSEYMAKLGEQQDLRSTNQDLQKQIERIWDKRGNSEYAQIIAGLQDAQRENAEKYKSIGDTLQEDKFKSLDEFIKSQGTTDTHKRLFNELAEKATGGNESGLAAIVEVSNMTTKAEQEKATELQEEGKRLLEQSANEIGATTLDNVEERIKKVKEISTNILGKETDFNEQVKKVRESLAKFEFVIMDATTQTKFAEGLAGLNRINTFVNTVKGVVTSLAEIKQVLGSGTSVKGTADSIKTVMSEIKTSFEKLDIPDMKPALKKLDDLTQPMKDIVTKVGSVFSGIGVKETKASLDAMLVNARGIQTNSTEIASVLSKISPTITANGNANITASAQTIKNQVEAMANAIKEFNTALAQLAQGQDTIKVKLGATANALGVRDAEYNLSRGPLNFQFKIDINVDGKSLEKTVVGRSDSVIVKAFGAVETGKGQIQGVGPGLTGVSSK